MFIAHAPAGYIIGKNLCQRLKGAGAVQGLIVLAAILGSIAPDFDLLYFYFVDHRQTHHHLYWSHYPIVWIGLILVSGIWFFTEKQKAKAALVLSFSIGGFFHIVLDTVAGDVFWFAPFGFKPFSFFTVLAVYKPWWLNFFLHWSFLFEITIMVLAVLLLRRESGKIKK
ncbi:MAG: metal-dependent hydrolase [Giesbergeria sp.]